MKIFEHANRAFPVKIDFKENLRKAFGVSQRRLENGEESMGQIS